MNTGVLASGNLGLSTIENCIGTLNPTFIATDRNSAGIIEYALGHDIPLFIGNPRNGNLVDFLGREKIDVLLSVNYLFLIEKDLIEMSRYPINFHGSLLPKYRGRTPHVWAIINNEKITGVTAHLMDEHCDTGDIILQKTVAIGTEATGAEILDGYKTLYPAMIKEIIAKIMENKLVFTTQDHSKATFFGKRTAEDGQIDWTWHRERIYNWIRAQAYPYPGAFSYIEGKKIIIDKIAFSDYGFDFAVPNGTILTDYPHIIVKTPNGAVELINIRENKQHCLKNKIFSYENR